MPNTNFQITYKMGTLANLPETKAGGTLYVTTDERALYLDISDSQRIRIGDFQEFATVAELEANTNPSTTALYYVTAINCLAKWDGTQYVQINLDTGATGVELQTGDTGNAITGLTYNPTTRKITYAMGRTFAEVGDASTDTYASNTLAGAKKYAEKLTNDLLGAASDGSTAETVRGARALADSKVASITAGSGIEVDASSPNSATAPSVGIKLSSKTGNDLSLETNSGEEGLYFHQAAAPTISVQEKASANTGYLKTYQVTVDGTAVGVDIDIPRDFLVKSAEVKTASAEDVTNALYTGITLNDKYIDFVVNTKGNTEKDAVDSHIYLPVNDLVDVYNAGNGLELGSNNTFAVKIDTTGAGGLTVGANGLKLAEVTSDTYTGGTKTADGVAGAMSSADKYKLNNISAEANKVTASATNGHIQIDGTDTTVYTLPNDVAVIGDSSTDTAASNTVEGAKKYADAAIEEALSWVQF